MMRSGRPPLAPSTPSNTNSGCLPDGLSRPSPSQALGDTAARSPEVCPAFTAFDAHPYRSRTALELARVGYSSIHSRGCPDLLVFPRLFGAGLTKVPGVPATHPWLLSENRIPGGILWGCQSPCLPPAFDDWAKALRLMFPAWPLLAISWVPDGVS